MSVKHILLGSLIDSSLHGYMLKFSFFDKVLRELGINDGQLYPTLKKLESGGLVVKEIIHQEGAASKHKYSITKSGKKEFVEWLENFSGEENKVRYDFIRKDALRFPLATIAAVNGYALAGGFDLATMCDIRIASENANFGHPEMSFGDVVYSPLHDIVGGAVARELVLTGRTIDASEALSIGLVSKVVPGEKLEEEAHNIATQIAKAPRHCLLRTKAKIINRARIEFKGTLDL